MAEPKTLEEAVEILVGEQLRVLYERQKRYGPANILLISVPGNTNYT